MVDRRLKQDFRKVMTSMFGEDGAQQRRTVQAVIRPDATVERESFLPVLPWSARDVFIPGALAAGSNLVRLSFPQGARLRHVAIAARVPPSGAALVLRLAGGGVNESFSLPAGQSTNPVGIDRTISEGVFLGVSVIDAAGAEDVTVSIHYTAGGA